MSSSSAKTFFFLQEYVLVLKFPVAIVIIHLHMNPRFLTLAWLRYFLFLLDSFSL